MFYSKVVICFQNRTFGIWNTTKWSINYGFYKLWFAFKIVPLVYEIQPYNITHYRYAVVICFQNRTFGIWNTTQKDYDYRRTSCDLLSKSYLWYMKYNVPHQPYTLFTLWFAFKIVPLVYEIQLIFRIYKIISSCDLLSKSYLWYMKYNWHTLNIIDTSVVICFQNRTFGIWNTT